MKYFSLSYCILYQSASVCISHMKQAAEMELRKPLKIRPELHTRMSEVADVRGMKLQSAGDQAVEMWLAVNESNPAKKIGGKNDKRNR
jgi:hypothetical protein